MKYTCTSAPAIGAPNSMARKANELDVFLYEIKEIKRLEYYDNYSQGDIYRILIKRISQLETAISE